MMDELARLERVLPALRRPGGLRRGQVVLSQQEAWELMTVTGGSLQAAGFEVRAPALSRRKPKPTLRLFAERGSNDAVVGANQLSDVRWSVLFDDVELTAADIARLAGEARPLVKSRGRWVELDSVDLKEAAAALAERADRTKLTGAEILRYSVGLEGTALAGGLSVEGSGWATDLLRAAGGDVEGPGRVAGGLPRRAAHVPGRTRSPGSASSTPPSSAAASRSTWASARRRRCSPTSPAPARPTRRPALVIAPPAVVGNWAAEAARFTPGLKVVVHHGASRASEAGFDREVRHADVVITTYGTAVRDIDVIADRTGGRSSSTRPRRSRTRPARRRRCCAASRPATASRSPARRSRTASATCGRSSTSPTPGLVGPRAAFIAQMSGEGEAALRALNGILVFRRTKAEPEVAAELPDKIEELDHCLMTPEQIGLYQAVIDQLVATTQDPEAERRQGAILAAITALKQICNHPAAYEDDGRPLGGPLGQAGPAGGDRRLGVRGRREGADLHPLRRVGPPPRRLPEPPQRAARSPATTAASAGAPGTGWSPTSSAARVPARSCCRSRPVAPDST